jgi:hypothetical protein
LRQEVSRLLSIPTSEAPDCSMDNEQTMNPRRFKQYKELTLTGLPGHRRHHKAIVREAKAICHRHTFGNEIVPEPYASLIWVRQSSRMVFGERDFGNCIPSGIPRKPVLHTDWRWALVHQDPRRPGLAATVVLDGGNR